MANWTITFRQQSKQYYVKPRHSTTKFNSPNTFRAVFQTLVDRQFPALDRNVPLSDDEQPAEPLTSRKRQVVKKFTPHQSNSRAKKRRIDSSSDESSSDDSFVVDSDESDESEDSDEEYVPITNGKSNNSNKNVKAKVQLKMETDSDSSYSDSSDDEESEGSISSESSDRFDSDSDFGPKTKKQMRRPKGSISKVQENIRKQYSDSSRTASTSKKTVKVPGFKNEIIDNVREMKDKLLEEIEKLGERLPKNTLDDLINKLGGSEKVAEMTGRKGRVTGLENGTVQYESRREVGVSLEMLNMKEKERFMSGEKVKFELSQSKHLL